jgi:hypothetical protein
MILDLTSYLAFFFSIALINAIACLGLNLQWGFAGLFNVGVAGFIAVGAYVSALLTAAPAAGRIGGLGWPILAGWASAMLVAAALAGVIGAVTLRLRADYLAITTFGIAVCLQLAGVDRRPLRHRLHSAPLRRPRGAQRGLQPRQSRAHRPRHGDRLRAAGAAHPQPLGARAASAAGG